MVQLRYSPEKKLHILDRLAWSDLFETFLATKYTAAKRFGLEGCETLIPGMKVIIDRAAELGMTSCVLGMPHRGMLLMMMHCYVVLSTHTLTCGILHN